MLTLGTVQVPALFLRRSAARRYVLRLKENGVLHITIPRGGSKAFAQEFVTRSSDWILRQFEKWKAQVSSPATWQHGTEVMFRGQSVPLEVKDGGVAFADQSIPLPSETADLQSIVLRHLQHLAVRELTSRTVELAQQHQLIVHRVTIRSQRSRWGSCSTKAHISLNWRLVQTPPFVADYIILHELMHLKHMNHSERFWKCVAEVCPEYQKAEAWLKTHGKSVLR